MLSPGRLDLLRAYWREARPPGWLIPGLPAINPLSARQLNRAFNAAKSVAGINRPAMLHTLRQSFATHLPEADTDVPPDGFHRIRRYGLLSAAGRKPSIERIRRLIGAAPPAETEAPEPDPVSPLTLREPCPDRGGAMRIVVTFRRGERPTTGDPPRKAAA